MLVYINWTLYTNILNSYLTWIHSLYSWIHYLHLWIHVINVWIHDLQVLKHNIGFPIIVFFQDWGQYHLNLEILQHSTCHLPRIINIGTVLVFKGAFRVCAVVSAILSELAPYLCYGDSSKTRLRFQKIHIFGIQI